MYELALKYLKFAARSLDGYIFPITQDCGCHQFLCDGKFLVPGGASEAQIDLATRAVKQLTSLNLLRWEHDRYIITNQGLIFVQTYDILERGQ